MKKFAYFFIAIILSLTAVAQDSTCKGKAAFQYVISGNTVNFYSSATTNNSLYHYWNFGDAQTSDAANPVHVYQSPGNYRIVHYIKDTLHKCYDSAVKEFSIAATVCDSLVAKFEWRRDSANSTKIFFMNQSIPNSASSAITYKWTFGDGSSSTNKSPDHIYTAPGQYEVCLTVGFLVNGSATPVCTKTFCSVVTIPVVCNLQPNFEWATVASNLLAVKFTNKTVLTSATAQYKWSFGDGTSSTDANPTHAYAKAGVYKVCLLVTISNTCVQEICKQITVTDCNIPADFNWTHDSTKINSLRFYLLPATQTIAPVSIKWSFGDGSYSTEYSPIHQYQQSGTYKVCLRIEYFAGCVKEICKEVTIQSSPDCLSLSKFVFERATNDATTYYFRAETNNATLKYTWTFGDGTGATGATASHKYLVAGTYNVCLTVYRDNNCASASCKEIAAGAMNCDQTTLKYEAQRLNPPINNAVKFIAVSSQSILSQSWTIWRNNATAPVSMSGSNPTYIFQDTGTYKVCLRAVTVNGCVKEVCDILQITQVPDACTLQVMPNPATTSIQFKMQAEVAQPVVASIVDMTGIRKAVFYLNAVPGSNTYNLPIATLPTGYYTLEVKVGNKICNTKFQKVN